LCYLKTFYRYFFFLCPLIFALFKHKANLSLFQTFYCVGISYKTADIDLRGKFSCNDSQLHALFLDAKNKGIKELIAITTCNRTELYGWAASEIDFVSLLCTHTQGTSQEFEQAGYSLKDEVAFEHLFRVGTGLESQILGDFEIISQIKKSFYRSKKMNMVQGSMERLINAVIQASKRIKTETEISSGATSVAFASVQFILKNVPAISSKNIVLFGTGKIGANTCENLVKHTQNNHIVLINRTQEKADKIAGKFPVKTKPYGELVEAIRDADVLIVATGAQAATITPDIIHTKKPLLILDLSIPRNVALEVNALDLVDVIHLDTLSQITDATFAKRKKHIPKAEEILNTIKVEFLEWLQHRQYIPTLKAFKEKIKATTAVEPESSYEETEQMAQKLTGQIAAYLRNHPEKADSTVALLQEVFQLTPDYLES
jgi:glutamyl-tRNA reductase